MPFVGSPFCTVFNAWELDENAHINVRWYFDRFDLAHRFLALESPDQVPPRSALKARHVRYHAELRGSPEPVVVQSRIADLSAGETRLVHQMTLPEKALLSATAIDVFEEGALVSVAGDEVSDKARPRALAGGAATAPSGSVLDLQKAGAQAFHKTEISVADCDRDGLARDRFFIGVASDAVPHVWGRLSITDEWLRENGCGRIAVEARISFHGPACIGDPIIALAHVANTGAKFIHVRYDMINAQTSACVATVEVVGMLMDLTARKVRPLPDELFRRAAAWRYDL